MKWFQSRSHLRHAERGRGIENEQIPAAEVDSEITSAPFCKNRHGSADENERDKDGNGPAPQKIKLMARGDIGHGQALESADFHHPPEGGAGEKNG